MLYRCVVHLSTASFSMTFFQKWSLVRIYLQDPECRKIIIGCTMVVKEKQHFFVDLVFLLPVSLPPSKQACRGSCEDEGVVVPSTSSGAAGGTFGSSSADASAMLVDKEESIDSQELGAARPSWQDMVIAYSTIPGYVAWRNEERGILLFWSLCSSSCRKNGTISRVPPSPISLQAPGSSSAS